MANVTNEINTIEELIEKFEGGYAVSVGEQGHIWVYDNALDAATDAYGHKAELVVTRCDDLYAEFDGGDWIGVEGPKAHEMAEDLDDLLAIFCASAATGYDHISDRDMTSLPTFGGDDIDEEGVWSWDEDRCLIGTCANDMEIVARASLDDQVHG